MADHFRACLKCQQVFLSRDHEVCSRCRDAMYAAAERHESLRLFQAPESIRGQLELDS